MIERGWDHIDLSAFTQDEYGWEDPKTKEWYPPTSTWMANITARRSDGQFFYVMVKVSDEEKKRPDLLHIVTETIRAGLDHLESFRTCDCVAGRPCDFHKRLQPETSEGETSAKSEASE